MVEWAIPMAQGYRVVVTLKPKGRKPLAVREAWVTHTFGQADRLAYFVGYACKVKPDLLTRYQWYREGEKVRKVEIQDRSMGCEVLKELSL
jgi:hypothetical protein